MVNMQKLLSIAILSTLIFSLKSMKTNLIERLDSRCSKLYLELIKDKDIDETFNILKDLAAKGSRITIKNYLLEQPDETEESIQKKLTVSYCLALYYQANQDSEAVSEINPISQLIVDGIYQQPYLNWNKTKSPYTLALTDITIHEFVTDQEYADHHEKLSAYMHPKDATKLQSFLDEAVGEGSVIDEDEGKFKAALENWVEKIDLNVPLDTGERLILAPVHLGNIDLLNLLIKHRVNLNTKGGPKWHTPLHTAVEKGDKNIARILLENGADIDAIGGTSEETPLHIAVLKELRDFFTKQRPNMVKFLIKHGADINAKDSFGDTVLHKAIQGRRSLYIAKFLLKNGADVNAKDIFGKTVLHRIAYKEYDHHCATKHLIKHGADVNAKDKDEQTPLHWAAMRGNNNNAKILIEYDADINAKDKFGDTPLHIASQTLTESTAKLLISHGADIKVINFKGQTPLHNAVSKGRADIARLLIGHGANPLLKDKSGKTALDYAHEAGDEAIISLLVDAIDK